LTDILRRDPPQAWELEYQHVTDRKRERIEDWLGVNEAPEFPVRLIKWEVRERDELSHEAWGVRRRKIDELDEFCGMEGEWVGSDDGVIARQIDRGRDGYMAGLMDGVWNDNAQQREDALGQAQITGKINEQDVTLLSVAGRPLR
jgi:hypothetical protein